MAPPLPPLLLPPQPQLHQHLQSPLLPFPMYQAPPPPPHQAAHYGPPVTEPAWAVDMLQRHQEQQQQETAWMGGTDCCQSAFAAMKLSEFPSQSAPLSVTFAPSTSPDSVALPDNPFDSSTWGVPSPPKTQEVDATNPFSAEAHRLPFDCIPDLMQRDPPLPDWSSGSSHSFIMEAGCNLTEAPSSELDVSSQATSLFSHATPFKRGVSLDKALSMQSDNFPEFSLF
jgi:hypothetical protein